MKPFDPPSWLAHGFMASLVCACAAHPAGEPAGQSASPSRRAGIDLGADLRFRIDAFSVPAASRPALEHELQASFASLAHEPGFRGHLVFEKTSGPTSLELVTISAWDTVATIPALPHGAASSGVYRVLPPAASLVLDPSRADVARIDLFSVPASSRGELDAAMHRNADFLATLPGYRGHVALEMTSGDTTFNLVTVAVWDSADAMRSAGEKVREEYQRIGFDMQGAIARWGVTASIGGYRASPAM
ncbi:MAG: hypothetical protein HOV81_34415 [Kofleriaceae bacterium]|nr:hypothetical protein [Kofleriaceae bacterium]